MKLMFLRRVKPRELSFAERLKRLEQTGCLHQQPRPGIHVFLRDGCAVVVEENPSGRPCIRRSGRLIGREVGELVDLGFQKNWRTPSGVTEPALANELKALHALVEDVREHLGLPSFYNESLGTVNDAHHYDRVAGRDGASASGGAH
jgi:hypothetical protein